MKRLSLLLLFSLAFGYTMAQTPIRYYEDITTKVKKTTNIKYGQAARFPDSAIVELTMDVYEPDITGGDTETARPVLIWAHGGSFLTGNSKSQPALPLGSKEDYPIVQLCERFARKGYVVVAMTYRTGWNPLASDDSLRQESVIQATWRAVMDGKGCVRYLRDNAANGGNTYKIDPNKIAFGGSQAGAYIPIHMLYFDKLSELELPKLSRPQSKVPYINLNNPAVGIDASIEGTSGPLGVSSAIQVGISLGGALADTSLIEGGEAPMICMHGTNDEVTPYRTDIVIPAATQIPVIEVSGGREIIRVAMRKNNAKQELMDLGLGSDNKYWFGADKGFYFSDDNGGKRVADGHGGLYSFCGASFQPYAWYDRINVSLLKPEGDPNPNRTQDSIKAMAYLDTVEQFVAHRLMKVFYPEVLSREESEIIGRAVNIFPNPAASGFVNIQLDPSIAKLKKVELFDVNGRRVQVLAAPSNHFALNTQDLAPGLYSLQMQTDLGRVAKKLMVE